MNQWKFTYTYMEHKHFHKTHTERQTLWDRDWDRLTPKERERDRKERGGKKKGGGGVNSPLSSFTLPLSCYYPQIPTPPPPPPSSILLPQQTSREHIPLTLTDTWTWDIKKNNPQTHKKSPNLLPVVIHTVAWEGKGEVVRVGGGLREEGEGMRWGGWGGG